MKAPVTIAEAIHPTHQARLLLTGVAPYEIIHCSTGLLKHELHFFLSFHLLMSAGPCAGWYLLTGHRCVDTVGKPFIEFAVPPHQFLLQCTKTLLRGKRKLMSMVIIPADPIEPSFTAAVALEPVREYRCTNDDELKFTHVSVRVVKLISPEVSPPLNSLRLLTSEQRLQLGSLMAYHPMSSSQENETEDRDSPTGSIGPGSEAYQGRHLVGMSLASIPNSRRRDRDDFASS